MSKLFSDCTNNENYQKRKNEYDKCDFCSNSCTTKCYYCEHRPRQSPRLTTKRELYYELIDEYWADERGSGCSDGFMYNSICDGTKYNEIEESFCELHIVEDKEMISRKIMVERYKDIKDFVNRASRYGDDLIIKGHNYEFPASSLMSVMSLVDISDGVKIMFPENRVEEIENDFCQWIVS